MVWKMSVHKMFSEMYKHAIQDEKLMRLLFYIPKDRNDDVTIKTTSRPDIVNAVVDQKYNNGGGIENVSSFDVISSVVKLRKRKDGDLDGNRSNALFIHPDIFKNDLTGTFNPALFQQFTNFDVYVSEDNQHIGLTLTKILDRLVELYNNQRVWGTKPTYIDSTSVLDDEEGYSGVRITFRNSYTL